jgi:hypothetical protein
VRGVWRRTVASVGQMNAGGGLDPDEEDYFDYYMMQGK